MCVIPLLYGFQGVELRFSGVDSGHFAGRGIPAASGAAALLRGNFLKTTCSCWLDSLSAPASCSFCSWPLSISFDSVLIVSLQNPFFIFATSNWENSVSCSLWPPRVCSPFTYPNKTSLPCWARRSKPRTCSKRSSLEAA